MFVRQLGSWTWTGSRTSRGGPSSWGAQCRIRVRPQESPRGQVQPHPGLSAQQLPLFTSTCLWTHPFFFFLQTFFCFVFSNIGTPAHLSVPQEILMSQEAPVPSTSSSALFWYLFFGNRFVLFLLFVYFWQKHFMYFYVYGSASAFCPANALHLTERVEGSHLSYQPVLNPPPLNFIATAQAVGDDTSSF